MDADLLTLHQSYRIRTCRGGARKDFEGPPSLPTPPSAQVGLENNDTSKK